MLSGRCEKCVRTFLWLTAVPFQNARGGFVFSERETSRDGVTICPEPILLKLVRILIFCSTKLK